MMPVLTGCRGSGDPKLSTLSGTGNIIRFELGNSFARKEEIRKMDHTGCLPMGKLQGLANTITGLDKDR